jgi:hypothetical protein
MDDDEEENDTGPKSSEEQLYSQDECPKMPQMNVPK